MTDHLESRLAIADLVANYCHGCDRHDESLFLSIWHDDAVWEFPPPWGAVKGRDEIALFLDTVIWKGLPETHHWTTNLVVTPDPADPDRATGICNVSCAATDMDGRSISIAGTYHDTYERRGGEWRIAVRAVELFWFCPAAEPWGTTLETRFQPPMVAWPPAGTPG